MSEIVAKNVKLYVGGKNLSRNLSQCELTINQDLVDNTKFGSSGRQRMAGLQDLHIMGSGFYEAGASSGSVYYSDPILQNLIGSTGRVYTMLPQGTGLGNVAYFSQAINGEYQPAGSIGDMFGFTFSADGDGHGQSVHRGVIMEAGTLASSDTQTPRNLGAVSSSQRAFINAQIGQWSSSQCTISIDVITSDTSGMVGPSTLYTHSFPSSDGTQATIGISSAVAGASGDTWYRIDIIAGTTADTMDGVVSIGIK